MKQKIILLNIFIFVLFILIKIIKDKKENFINFDPQQHNLLVYHDNRDLYVRFMDYLHNNGRKDKRIIYDYMGNPIYLDYMSNPRVINPMFLFDERITNNTSKMNIDRFLWMNPSNEKLIVINK